MATPRTVLVIGGGIVGLSSALALQERGLDVTLLDDAPERPPASWGNVGHIATEQVDPLASWPMVMSLPRRLTLMGGPVAFPPTAIATWLPFGLRLLAAAAPTRFRHGRAALSALLAEALPAWRTQMAKAGATQLLRDNGHLVAWESPATAVRGRRALARPVNDVVASHEATPDQIAFLKERLRTPFIDALRYAGTASVTEPGAVLSACRAAFLAAGGRIETGIATPEQVRRPAADLIVVAAGVRSRPLMRALGHSVPMIAERGYHIRSRSTPWPSDMPPIVFDDRAVVVSGSDAGVRATSFVEFTHHDAPPDARKWARLRQHVAELGLTFGDDVETWHGSRPTLPDYLPAIGRSRRNAQVLYAFGHQHLGLTLGPITGALIAALAVGERPMLDLTPFSLDRFG